MAKNPIAFLLFIALIVQVNATVCGCMRGSDEAIDVCAQICADEAVNNNFNLVHNDKLAVSGSLDVTKCIKTYGSLVYDFAKSQGVPNAMHELFQLIFQESNCNINAVGNNGLPKGQSRSWGCGLMQIESIHQGEFGGITWPASRNPDFSDKSCFKPQNNVKMGVSIYARYTAAMGGDPVMGLCAYNRGVTGARNFGEAACRSMVQSTYLRRSVPSTEEILRIMRGA